MDKQCGSCRFQKVYEWEKPCMGYREGCQFYQKGEDMIRDEAIKELSEMRTDAWTDSRQIEALEMAVKALEQKPSDETVSIEAFKQVMWERDIAIEQLKELGYEFGEKIETIDDKPVTGIRKYRKEARRWKRKYIRVNNQLSKCKKLLENDDIQSHTDEMWEKAKESEVNNGQEND